jgi:maltose O-acetyltransferase
MLDVPDILTEKQKMVSGRLYRADTEELTAHRRRAQQLTFTYNATAPHELHRRAAILDSLLGIHGENTYIEPPFRCDYGTNIYIGDNFFANYDCIILDEALVTIGDHVMLGPRTSLMTVAHPIDAGVRASGLEYAKPIHIGDDVWFGGGVIVNPGVTIGNGTVIGSGSVVTKDIPANVVAVGNPCHVLREVTDDDRRRWENLARTGEVC